MRQGRGVTYVGKKVFTRIPPAQYLVGSEYVSEAATPIGFGWKNMLES
jgi:hypothetical protein